MSFERRLREYPRIRCVGSFDELVSARFEDGVNALCWVRHLAADFDEVVRALGPCSGVSQLDEADLSELSLSAAGAAAVLCMLEDVRRLRERGLAPELNYIGEYTRDDATAVVATDVYSFHVDRSPVEVDTWLCTYYGAPSEGLANEDSIARVNVPETRARLRARFGGRDEADFAEFLRENHYDLHYSAVPGAQPWSYGVGNLWRVATAWPGSSVPPCIHRAPADVAGQGRLLLIS
jgi:hypothetical protein